MSAPAASRLIGRSDCPTTHRRTTRCRSSSFDRAIQKASKIGAIRQAGCAGRIPNPKTSGNGRYTYLAAYAYALDANRGDHAKAKAFVAKFLANVPVFDTGGRGATTTFVEREIGDVLVTFESEVTAIRKEYGKVSLQAIVPSLSLRADFPVAVVDKVVDRKGTRKLASAYIEFLFSPQGQDIIARHYNRVNDTNVAKKYAAQFPAVKLATIESVFGGWDTVTNQHFKDGGILDQALGSAPAK